MRLKHKKIRDFYDSILNSEDIIFVFFFTKSFIIYPRNDIEDAIVKLFSKETIFGSCYMKMLRNLMLSCKDEDQVANIRV